MVRKSDLKKSRHHVMLYDEDWDFLETNYGPNSKSPIGISAAITAIIHAKIMDMRARAATEYERLRAVLPDHGADR